MPIHTAFVAVATAAALGVGTVDSGQIEAAAAPSSEIVNQQSEIAAAFVVVHLEPGVDARSLEQPATYFEDVVRLVDRATDRDVRLTLAITPQYADYIGLDPRRRQLVRQWQRQGHELALHHHGLSNFEWDGYSNWPTAEADSEFMGRMQSARQAVQQVAGQPILTCACSDQDIDWPDGLPFGVYGQGHATLLSEPLPANWNGQHVQQLGYAALVGPDAVGLNEVWMALEQGSAAETLGLVFHDEDIQAVGSRLGDVLDVIEEWGVPVRTVRDILIEATGG